MIRIPPKLALLSFVLAIGWASPLFRLAGAPQLLASGARVGIATLLLAPFFAGEAFATLRAKPAVAARALAAGALLAAHFAAWVPSLALTTVAASTVLVATQPLFAALLETFLLRVTLPRRLIVGIAIAFAGAAILASGDFDSKAPLLGSKALLGDALSVAGAMFAAGYYVMGRALRESLPLGGYLVLVNGSAAALLLVASWAIGEPWFSATAPSESWLARSELIPAGWNGIDEHALLFFLLLALIPHLLGHGCANVALRHMPATVVNVATLGEPLLASTIAFFLFKEQPSAMVFVGGPVVLAGLALALTARRA